MVLIDFYERFPNEQACWDHFLSLKWPDGFICPSCSSTKGCFKPSRKLFECYECKHQSSLSSGTIFSLRNVLFVIPLGILLSFIIFYFIYRVNDKNFDAQRYLVIYSIYNKLNNLINK